MSLRPYNRHLLVEPKPPEESAAAASILVPDEFKPMPLHAIVTVVAIASDCSIDLIPGDKIVCSSSMLEEVKIHGQAYYLLLENYVLCSYN
jgi:co-chaperonin GroES (HSP10)|tara:strand:+ start:6049 stop:6321 length:273 start_codon:yes stop_codon:yes gene_type:complete